MRDRSWEGNARGTRALLDRLKIVVIECTLKQSSRNRHDLAGARRQYPEAQTAFSKDGGKSQADSLSAAEGAAITALGYASQRNPNLTINVKWRDPPPHRSGLPYRGEVVF